MSARHMTARRLPILLIGILAAIALTGCELGRQTPTQPLDGVPETQPVTSDPANPLAAETPVVISPDALALTPTATLLIAIPATNTPVPQLLPAEQIQQVVIEGTDHRSQEEVRIRVRRGVSVSNVTCTWTLQATGQTGSLGSTISSTQLDANTFEDVYAFTPTAGGDYVITCNGVATSVSGQRNVGATSNPFTVAQKG